MKAFFRKMPEEYHSDNLIECPFHFRKFGQFKYKFSRKSNRRTIMNQLHRSDLYNGCFEKKSERFPKITLT